MASSPYFIFSGQFLCFVIYFFSFSIVFSLCLFSFLIPLCFLLLLFLCSPWFLKFSLDALADSLPQLFSNCFQFFFFFPMKGALTQGGRFQLLVCLYCSHETLAKLFLSGLLPVDGLCGLHGFLGLLQHQMPCGILTWGRSAGWGRK